MKIVAYNAAWQYPARTEYAAYIAARQLDNERLKSFTYLGFPWASLIDSFQSSRLNRWEVLQALTDCIEKNQRQGRVVTTCQHIYALNYIHLFQLFGVTDLFFPHKLISHSIFNGMRIHPFPLFPVQASPPGFEAKKDRQYLASFIGAYNSNVYLTDVREHIFQLEGKDPQIKIVKRDRWHYDRTVYDLQMKGSLGSHSEIEKEKANEHEYKKLLADSFFSLCPSGSGPNSIRLYESMTYGSIPVVLAAGLDLTYLHAELQDIIIVDDDTSAGLLRALERLQAARKEEESTIDEKGRALIELRQTYEPQGYSAVIADALQAY